MENLKKEKAPKAEWLLLIILAAIQFVNILDFVIIMPLGPQFMRVFEISPREFGFIVSSYTFSASIFGFLGAFFIDRFDRRKALLTLLSGFTIGSLLCAIAPTYQMLIMARILSGAFGGIMGAIIFAVIGDVIPAQRRGAATGTVMSGFAVASVVGIPLGLYLANHSDWHAPFFLLTGLCLVIFAVAYYILPVMVSHLNSQVKKNPLKDMGKLLSESNHLRAFALTVMVTMAGFSVIPFLSPYMVSNVGLSEKDLPYIYLVGGFCTLFSARFIGILADRIGKLRMFLTMATLSMIPVLIITNLQKTPFLLVIAITTIFTICISGRMIPAMAMITGSVKPEYRGSFMSVNSSIQQMASGVASFTAGMIISKAADGRILHYNTVGLVACASTLVCLYLATRLRYDEKPVGAKAEMPLSVEG